MLSGSGYIELVIIVGSVRLPQTSEELGYV